MNEIPNWVNSILALVGGLFGAWVGVKIAITRLEGRVDAISDKYVILRADFDELRTTFNHQTSERSGYIQQIKENTSEISLISSRVEATRGEMHSIRNQITPYSMILQMLCEKAGLPWKSDR